MDEFAKKGNLGSANGMAALAIVRALLRNLEKSGVLIPKDVAEVLSDAIAQIPGNNNERSDEARRIIEKI